MLLLWYVLLNFLHPNSSLAGVTPSLPFDPSQYADLNALIGSEISSAVIKAVGFTFDHKPYEPATPLGTKIGLDLGLELSLIQLPSDLGPALEKAGPLAGSVTLPPFIPLPRFHLHKGLGPFVDLGLSAIWFQGMRLYGGDIKTVLYNPEEGGITSAMRFCYSLSNIGFASSKTISTQLLFSRAVGFGDPYFGVGYQVAVGSIEFPLDLGNGISTTLKGSDRATAYTAFMGLQLKAAVLGLQITLEGSYSSVGMDTLGTKIGLGF